MLNETYTIEGLKLERPLAVLDIEATGINRSADRIIDLAIVKLMPGGSSENHVFRVHPECPIPQDSTEIHGITDEDVKDCPTFKEIAEHVAEVLENCDFGGYNCNRFDLPMLAAEFVRAKVPFSLDGRLVLDAQRIYHLKEPRDLTAAVRYFCRDDHAGAHGALADVVATIRVIEGQLQRYPDLPRDIPALDDFINPINPTWVDRSGKLRWTDGEVTVNFGKHTGRSLREMAQLEPGFLRWMISKDFDVDTKQVVTQALAGTFPQPPAKNTDVSAGE